MVAMPPLCYYSFINRKDKTMEKEKTSGLHKDIKYTTRENGEVSGFRFTSDEGREKFRQMQILNVLEMEVMSTMGIRFYRGSIVNVLKSYFPDIPRTKKGAYKYLKARGYYPENK
jgi:hypothetical protein